MWVGDNCGLVGRKLDQFGVGRKKTLDLALLLILSRPWLLIDFFELGQWFSKCGAWTSSINVIWEFIRNADSQAH